MFTVQEYLEWRNHPITGKFYEEIQNTAADIMSKIMGSDSSNQARDQFLKGMFKACDEIVAFKPELINEDGEETDPNA